MFILQFFRYLRGYVRFQAQGVFLERFLNLVARERIPVWDSRKRDYTYTGYVSAGNYRRLRRHAKKTGTRVRLAQKYGAPFQRRRYRKRNGLALGFALFALFLFGMSRFIWRIDVNGNKNVQEARIIEALEEIGVKPGTLRGSIDVRDAERRVLMQVSELSWVALNIEGSHLQVEVKESAPPPEMVDPARPCNILASHDGQVLDMRVYEGDSMVKKGDAVLAGDILVSGVKQDRMGQSLFKHALADITARVQQELVVEVPLSHTEYVETGEVKTRRYLQLFKLDLPLSWLFKIPQPYHVERELKALRIASAELPFGIFEERYILMEATPATYTEEQARNLAMRELRALEQVEMDDAEIEEKTLVGVLTNGVYTLRAEYVCIRNIAWKQEILVEKQDAA